VYSPEKPVNAEVAVVVAVGAPNKLGAEEVAAAAREGREVTVLAGMPNPEKVGAEVGAAAGAPKAEGAAKLAPKLRGATAEVAGWLKVSPVLGATAATVPIPAAPNAGCVVPPPPLKYIIIVIHLFFFNNYQGGSMHLDYYRHISFNTSNDQCSKDASFDYFVY